MTHPAHSVITGDCLEVMRGMEDGSVDAVVTDPPYGLSFMGKRWDYDVPAVDVWAECLRVLKPGGHLLAFAGTRTQHRMCCRIEDAGFEIRDMIAWVYGSGFPKSLDVSKAIDKAAGAERARENRFTATIKGGALHAGKESGSARSWNEVLSNIPATDAAREWSGWGTALKPALEPITVARKPFTATVAANVLQHGTGALNIDGCRVAGEVDSYGTPGNGEVGYCGGFRGEWVNKNTHPESARHNALGRWPSNLIHDGSAEAILPLGDNARFFYCAKASKDERDEGCDGGVGALRDGGVGALRDGGRGSHRHNHHPTVKPTQLMRYLCRLVTPPRGTVLDPFCGSGTTGVACAQEGFSFVGIEREPEYVAIAEARIDAATRQLELTL